MEYPKSIIEALFKIMSAHGYIKKDGTNTFHKYNYVSEAALLKALRPTMIEVGLLLIPSGKAVSEVDGNGNTFVTLEYTLAHTDGSVWPEKLTAYGCGNDRSSKGTVGDKGLYKAITGANKYLLFKLFQIETGDDPENDAGSDTTERNKYVSRDKEKSSPTVTQPTPRETNGHANTSGESITDGQKTLLVRKGGVKGMDEEELNLWLLKEFGIESVDTIPPEKYAAVKAKVEL